MNISPAKPVPLILNKGSRSDKARLEHTKHLLVDIAKLASITWHDDHSSLPLSATGLQGEMEILIPMAGLINTEAELARLDKALLKLGIDIKKAQAKLNTPTFVEKAPPAVVEKEKQLLAELEQAEAQLAQQRSRIASL